MVYNSHATALQEQIYLRLAKRHCMTYRRMTGVSDIESVRQEYNASAMRTSNARPYGGQELLCVLDYKSLPLGGARAPLSIPL